MSLEGRGKILKTLTVTVLWLDLNREVCGTDYGSMVLQYVGILLHTTQCQILKTMT